jgi:hypothetical protein
MRAAERSRRRIRLAVKLDSHEETQLCVLQKVPKKDWRAAKLILKETQLCVLQKVLKKDWRAAKLIHKTSRDRLSLG